MLTLDKVYHAKYVLKPVIRETDVRFSEPDGKAHPKKLRVLCANI